MTTSSGRSAEASRLESTHAALFRISAPVAAMTAAFAVAGSILAIEALLHVRSATAIAAILILCCLSLVWITVWTSRSRDHLRLADMIHSSEDAIVSKTFDGVIQTWNKGAERIYGYSANEAIGHSALMLVPEENREEHLGLLKRIARGESVPHYQTARVRKDGVPIDVSVTLSPVRNSRGEIVCVSAFSRDITEHKRAEARIHNLNQDLERRVEQRTAELAESERQVRKKLESIISPRGDTTVLELRDVFDIQAVQALMDELWKLTGVPVAILDLDGNELVGAGREDICSRFHRARPGSGACISDPSFAASTGGFRLFKCENNLWEVLTPIMLGERHIGNLYSGQFLLDDETVDREAIAVLPRNLGFAEAEYMAALYRLPRISRARIAEATELYSSLAGVLLKLGYSTVKLARANAETERSNQELLRSSKELEGFAYSVSHDLRAPLRHLDGFLSLLSKRGYQSLDANGRHYIDSMQEASQRMGHLIDDLLQFSRLGRAEMRKGKVNLNQIIEEARKELELEWRGRTIVWDVDRLPIVNADQVMMRQVMQNLIANALKFTHNRDRAVISIGARSAQKGELLFFVQDNGAGFDMRYYNKLFQVFQRLHGEHEFDGTGIGLANVRRIVERHGGRVWAKGEVDKGAVFYFSLPNESIWSGGSNELVETHLAR